ncbi:hypothetical protein BKA67DRAFT_113096 [Truncatella angustata]|uniref:Zn(2)-C6 fungal-type domain-containing protein n=1 Tax=Truncatella angustata TaxID=152316 RepID=A0A9P8RGA8_9PEZI|nr:uncharacterized protein BKA67DRAFT_113096 [Truncatella angustata]KAH6645458.1 hypothetical protein BKA67DRAFT_113096 [Truncatella angustata]
MSLKPPRQPKLRSSCNGCGSAKVKCDRDQPMCGRCATLGITCVYGVSRKMGKPARERLKVSDVPRVSGTPEKQPAFPKDHKCDDDNRDYCLGRSGRRTDPSSRSGSSSSSSDSQSTWRLVRDDIFCNIGAGTNLLGALPPLMNLSGMEFGDWAPTDELLSTATDHELFATFDWPPFENPANYSIHEDASQQPQDTGVSSLQWHQDNTQAQCDRKCLRESYDILCNLSLMNPGKFQSTMASETTTTGAPADHFPLDNILQLNRECSERLCRLLNCSCAGYPHLALLHASIISRILIWYHQGLSYSSSSSHTSSPSLIATALNTAVSPTNLLHKAPGMSPPSPWSTSTVVSNTSTGGSSTPTKMQGSTQVAMGSFITDDERVQASLRIQLLLSELTRLAVLIKDFASRGSKAIDVSASGTINPLYHSLGSWLLSEHASIMEIMRSRLMDFSI